METTEKKVAEKITNANPDKREGEIASMIEEQTAKIPSDAFLWAALGAMAVSLTLKVLKKDEKALFVGHWAPSFLILGIYNKLVKQLGHDSKS
jgi:hypothetical protein